MRTLLVPLLLCLLLPASAQTVRREAGDVYAVMAEVDRIASAGALWPNFDPRRVPVEIYNGQTTFLFRHPKPPEGFISLSSRQGVWALPGRHESVTANAPVPLNGVWTATAMFEPDGRHRSLTERAALVIHEMFHVFQREHHPRWSGDELELFNYPFDDREVLALRRLETEALRRAAESATSLREAACWSRVALSARRERFARLTEGARTYERAIELNEGLARYVEARAAGRRGSGLTVQEYAAEDLRARGYASGHALALLLERFAPAWKTQLEAGENLSLDELLAAALPPETARRVCALPASFEEAVRERARAEVADLLDRRETLRREYASAAGWKIIVEAAAGAPLWPQGFDPLNVRRLGGREVLHTRFLKLGNDAGAIEILGPRSLTEGAGAHPLFGGVSRLTIAGLAVEPSIEESKDKITLGGEGLKAEFRGARMKRAGQTITINLEQPSQ